MATTVEFRCSKCKVNFTISVDKEPIRLSGKEDPKEAKPITVTGKCPQCNTIYTKRL